MFLDWYNNPMEYVSSNVYTCISGIKRYNSPRECIKHLAMYIDASVTLFLKLNYFLN